MDYFTACEIINVMQFYNDLQNSYTIKMMDSLSHILIITHILLDNLKQFVLIM